MQFVHNDCRFQIMFIDISLTIFRVYVNILFFTKVKILKLIEHIPLPPSSHLC